MKKIAPYLILICFCLSGCSILFNLDEVCTLEDYSHESDAQHRLVKSIDDHYDALAKVLAQGQMGDYKDEASFERTFGDPILKKDLSGGGQRWLYRHAIYRSSKDKVYVYFDPAGKMIKWEKLPCSKFL
jgi:hypothetical protein